MADERSVAYELRGSRVSSVAELSEHLETLKTLAAGRDPISGATFPNESCYQSGKVVRALFAAVTALEKVVPRDRDLPKNAGKAWLAEEDSLLTVEFDRGVGIGELARKHGRTRGAIQSRLVKLGKLPPIYEAKANSVASA